MGQGLSAWTERERWDQLTVSIKGDPQPSGVSSAAELEAEFIELDMGDVQAAEELDMHGVRMQAGAGQAKRVSTVNSGRSKTRAAA